MARKEADHNLESRYGISSLWAERFARLILAGLALEIVSVFALEKSLLEGSFTIASAALIWLGVWGELHFASRAKEAGDGIVARANERAAEANKVAEEERHARLKLEAQLRPRTLTDEQIALLQGLRDKFPEISLASEVDIETHVFTQQIAMAFMSAGIRVHQYRRGADAHTAGIQIYDPLGIDNSGPEYVKPLLEVFRKIERNVIAIWGPMPPDIPASSEFPIVIVGGRFLLPSDSTTITHLAKLLAAKTPNNTPQNAKVVRK
jgi:hypothetical protein